MSDWSDSPLSPEAAHAAECSATALALRADGHTFRAIAQMMQCSVSTAHKYIKAGLDERRKTIALLAADVIEIELDRLDAMHFALRTKIAEGDTQAINAALAVMARRAKLLGLDAAEKIEHTGTPTRTEAAAIAESVFGSKSALKDDSVPQST
jgi:hypothetical protein